nr:hypothetical protein [Anaerolineae bacterium]
MLFKSWLVKGIGALTAVGIIGAAGVVAAQGEDPLGPTDRVARSRIALGIVHEVVEQTGLGACDVLGSLSEGNTLNEVIAGAGVESQVVIDGLNAHLAERLAQAVANGRVTQERADQALVRAAERLVDVFEEDMSEGVQQVYERRCGENAQPSARQKLIAVRAVMQAVSEETGLDNCAIVGELANGQTLDAIITSEGGDTQALVDGLIAHLDERLAEAIANGRITQEEADDILANASVKLGEMMSADFGEDAQRFFDARCPPAGTGA